MQHLSRRFSGFIFLYVVIAQIIFDILFNIGLFSNTIIFYTTAPFAFYFKLFYWLIVFLPPIIFIAVRKYPFAGVLRLNTFSGRQLLFTVGISIFLYLFINTFGSMIENLYKNILLPDFPSFYFRERGFSLWPGILTSGLIPAVLYEFTFIGAVYSGFRNITPLKACLFVGILFGLFRLSVFEFLQYAVYGFVLCFISNRSGSIIPGMLTVFLVLLFRTINLDGLLYFGVFASSGISEGLTAFIYAFISIIIGGLLLWKMPDTSNTSRQIGKPKIGQLFKKLIKLRRRLQQSFLSDYVEDKSKVEDERTAVGDTSNPVLLKEEIYPNAESKQNKNTGFIIGSAILIILTLFMFAFSTYLTILNTHMLD